jgi:hypothetical protein
VVGFLFQPFEDPLGRQIRTFGFLYSADGRVIYLRGLPGRPGVAVSFYVDIFRAILLAIWCFFKLFMDVVLDFPEFSVVVISFWFPSFFCEVVLRKNC